MRRILALAVPAVLLAGAASADPDCSKMTATLPMWQVAQAFETAGGKIRELKVSDGCYEIYGMQNDKKVEIYYSPVDGSELQREED
jgi:hypothetical protein